MRTFLSIFRLEFRRSHAPWNAVAWGLIFLLSIIYTNHGINGIKALPEKEKSFKEIQDANFEKIRSYTYYSIEGIWSLYRESNPSILFNNSILPTDSISKIDGRVTISLLNNLKSKILNPANLTYNMDFSGIVLFLVSIYFMYMGYDAKNNRAFLKLLKGGRSTAALYFSTVVSRFILIALYFCAMFFSLLLFILLRGIRITAIDFSGFLAFLFAALVLLFFFYCVGGHKYCSKTKAGLCTDGGSVVCVFVHYYWINKFDNSG
jgi:hypothetical protein